MNKIKSISSVICIAATVMCNVSVAASFPALKGDWFGQQTPGLKPEVFAANTVSIEGRYEFGVSFSPDLKEMYFTALDVIEGVDTSPKIMYSKIENGYWTKPKEAGFTGGKMKYELVPYASLNEDRVYFTGRSPDSKESGIWYVTREDEGLSEAKRFESSLNTGRLSDFNQGIDGDMIFTNMSERRMYTAKKENGQFLKAKPMDIEFGLHGFISPNEDYLLVNARNRDDDARKDSDLFVYFKEADGSWSKPINLGTSINTPYSETVARVSPDGQYLFFARYNEPDDVSNIYWVSTQVITELKEAYFKG
ncbi:PD40 domain-containing protein [Pseudoalteromonas luteoviolacea]|uniref:PD40 domain-containing protein n=1 Tax=Pseudoalteromonas luteoviolacea TaxID=43657 RepID=UPI001B3A40F6|nr:PD40 domain-containing protein [Pseudoalteromonas luteoviolacea]MBQ4879136.1 PD40 domain-containing protein [Pseudoalteromonas luteoviolacea]MBQ4908109.1 PD40 domain-containing protein [Pseudoalteromonas luteoviolacea]